MFVPTSVGSSGAFCPCGYVLGMSSGWMGRVRFLGTTGSLFLPSLHTATRTLSRTCPSLPVCWCFAAAVLQGGGCAASCRQMSVCSLRDRHEGKPVTVSLRWWAARKHRSSNRWFLFSWLARLARVLNCRVCMLRCWWKAGVYCIRLQLRRDRAAALRLRCVSFHWLTSALGQLAFYWRGHR
jgi:hypothetical protein